MVAGFPFHYQQTATLDYTFGAHTINSCAERSGYSRVEDGLSAEEPVLLQINLIKTLNIKILILSDPYDMLLHHNTYSIMIESRQVPLSSIVLNIFSANPSMLNFETKTAPIKTAKLNCSCSERFSFS
jgi:hypothetical protein